MIWHDVWEDFDHDYYFHPLYTSPSTYRPVWHAIQGSLNTPTLIGHRDGEAIYV